MPVSVYTSSLSAFHSTFLDVSSSRPRLRRLATLERRGNRSVIKSTNNARLFHERSHATTLWFRRIKGFKIHSNFLPPTVFSTSFLFLCWKWDDVQNTRNSKVHVHESQTFWNMFEYRERLDLNFKDIRDTQYRVISRGEEREHGRMHVYTRADRCRSVGQSWNFQDKQWRWLLFSKFISQSIFT